MQYDANKLRTFLVVADALNVSRAAITLRRTQSAISQQLAALEEEIGLALFERKKGKIYLTREGREIYQVARKTLGELDEGIQSVQGSLNQLTGIVRFGVAPTQFDYLFIPVVRKFMEKYPRAQVHIFQEDNQTIEKGLLSGRIDLASLIVFEDKRPFVIRPLLTFYAPMVASPSYLKKVGSHKGFKDIVKMDLIDANPEMIRTAAWFTCNGQNPKRWLRDKVPSLVAQDHETVKRLLLEGLGAGTVPEFMIREELKKKTLVEVMPGAHPIDVGADLVYPKTFNLTFAHREFIRLLHEAFPE